jgi:hypothetical protein
MRILRVLLLLALFSSIIYPQIEEQIELIKKDYYKLKELRPKLKKKSTVELKYSAEGATIDYFVNDNNQVLIIEAEFLGETGKANHEYYFKNDSLFFLFIKTELYNAPITTLFKPKDELEKDGLERQDPNKSRFLEDRYYFYNGELIQWLDNDRNIVPDTSKEFTKAENDHWEFSRELLNKYKSEEKR